MTRTLFAAIAATFLLLSAAVAPVAATPGDGQVDECKNAGTASGAQGPPGFVADLVPDFLADLFADLPVPNFVKSAVGAPTCSTGSN